jgi:hypothetical protein
MKKLVLLFSAIFILGASLANAQGGLNLAWTNCITQANAVADIAYACDQSRNGIPFKGVISFISPDNLTAYVGMGGILDVRTADAALSDWWKLGTGECRDGNLAFPASITGVGTGATGACQNPYLGGGTAGGYLYRSDTKDGTVPLSGWGRTVLSFVRDTPTALTSGQQYVAGVFTLDTFGDDGTCAGCATAACIVINEVTLYQTAGTPPQDIYIVNTQDTRQYITWQGGAIGGAGCPTAVPTQNVTWGSIKAIYR